MYENELIWIILLSTHPVIGQTCSTVGMAFGSSNMFSYLKHQSDGFVELLFCKYHVERNECQRLIWQFSYILLLPVPL